MSTVTIKADDSMRKWYVVDASNRVLGRMATAIAWRLRGKHKPEYTPNMDLGDYIIVVNAEKVQVTGEKEEGKIYYHHTGHMGGLKTHTFAKLKAKDPTRAIEKAIKGMLPKGPLGRAMFSKLKVYAGSEHQHQAQQPELLILED